MSLFANETNVKRRDKNGEKKTREKVKSVKKTDKTGERRKRENEKNVERRGYKKNNVREKKEKNESEKGNMFSLLNGSNSRVSGTDTTINLDIDDAARPKLLCIARARIIASYFTQFERVAAL